MMVQNGYSFPVVTSLYITMLIKASPLSTCVQYHGNIGTFLSKQISTKVQCIIFYRRRKTNCLLFAIDTGYLYKLGIAYLAAPHIQAEVLVHCICMHTYHNEEALPHMQLLCQLLHRNLPFSLSNRAFTE